LENRTLGCDNRRLGCDNRTKVGKNRTLAGNNRRLGCLNRTMGGNNRMLGSENRTMVGKNRTFGCDNRTMVGKKRTFGGNNIMLGRHNTIFPEKIMAFLPVRMEFWPIFIKKDKRLLGLAIGAEILFCLLRHRTTPPETGTPP